MSSAMKSERRIPIRISRSAYSCRAFGACSCAPLGEARVGFGALLIDHRRDLIGLDLERHVKVEVVLRLEIEVHVGRFEECEKRSVGELEEGVERARLPAGVRLADLERTREAQSEEVLVEAAGV